MTEAEARERCLKLTAESPERATHSWVPREAVDGGWTVVKIGIPGPASQVSGTATATGLQGIKSDPRIPAEQRVPNNMTGF